MELVLEQLAAHIPDLVIQKPVSDHLPQTVHSYGVVVFADISGTLLLYYVVVLKSGILIS